VDIVESPAVKKFLKIEKVLVLCAKIVGIVNFLLICSCFIQFFVEFSGFNDCNSSSIGKKYFSLGEIFIGVFCICFLSCPGLIIDKDE
jgi:hypothetical protein